MFISKYSNFGTKVFIAQKYPNSKKKEKNSINEQQKGTKNSIRYQILHSL
jgi:hypothetical protein